MTDINPIQADVNNLDKQTNTQTNQPNTQTNQPNTQPNQPADEGFMTYVIYGVIILFTIVIIYLAYKRFMKMQNAPCKDKFVPGLKQERDDTTVDFNLNEAIQELEIMQSNILKKLSTTINI